MDEKNRIQAVRLEMLESIEVIISEYDVTGDIKIAINKFDLNNFINVMEYKMRNGPIGWQISISKSSQIIFRYFSPLSRFLDFIISDWKCRSRL